MSGFWKVITIGIAIVGLMGQAALSSAQEKSAADKIDTDYPVQYVQSVEDFNAAREAAAQDPRQTAALFVLALLTHTEDQDLGRAEITALLTPVHLVPGNVYQGLKPGVGMKSHLDRLKNKPYIARSYFKGTNPENGYQVDKSALTVVLRPDMSGDSGPDRRKVFVLCSGADTPRGMTLKKDDQGQWKVSEASSLFVGIRPPK